MNRKKCRYCPEYFRPTRTGQKHCGAIECQAKQAEEWIADRRAKQARALAKEQRKADQQKREELRPRREWIKMVQEAFNAMIRFRDRHENCISCDRPLARGSQITGSNIDCGHYRSVGSAPHLRFDEENAHAQCVRCNRHGAGVAVDYRLGLIRRRGLAVVERIESDNTPRHWSIDDLKRMLGEYRSRLSAMKREAERECA